MALVILASCADPHLGWDGASHEDPSPSGPGYLREYKESHYRDIGRRFSGALDWDELLTELDQRAVLFLGDHHEDVQLHERMLSVLVRLAKSRDIAIGVEALGTQDEPALARFLSGELDLDLFRDQVARRWRGSWLESHEVDRDFYRRLCVLGHDLNVPIFALEPTPRIELSERDAVIAERIQAAAKRWPDRLIVVVVGHAHLLGAGKVVERLRMPCKTFGARMSRSLIRDFREQSFREPFLETDAGVIFFNPAPGVL